MLIIKGQTLKYGRQQMTAHTQAYFQLIVILSTVLFAAEDLIQFSFHGLVKFFFTLTVIIKHQSS